MHVAVVVTAKNEAPYLLEWVAYYYALGIDSFVFFTNDNDDNTLEILQQLEKAEWLNLSVTENRVMPGQKPQYLAYQKAMSTLETIKPDWVFCCDMDEYLVLNDGNTLKEFLSERDDVDSIAFNWKHFGSAGSLSAKSRMTIERFTKRSPPGYKHDKMFKSIFKYSEHLQGFGPHRPKFRPGYKPVYIYPDTSLVPVEFWKEGVNPSSTDTAIIDHAVASVHHYAVRSKEEYKMKQARGRLLRVRGSMTILGLKSMRIVISTPEMLIT